MALEDAKILLNDAKNLLDEIELLYSHDFNTGKVSPILRVRIKQYLDNVNSSLDYAAYEVFTTVCANRIKTEQPEKFDTKERRVMFPCFDDKSKFDNFIRDRFPYLKEENEQVIDVLVKYQPFPTKSKWLNHLKELVNKNKHRYLTAQQRTKTTHIKHLSIKNGEIANFNGSTEINLVFSDIDQPVLKTLKRIYASAPTIIKDIEEVL